jgi:hypothetical protein
LNNLNGLACWQHVFGQDGIHENILPR